MRNNVGEDRMDDKKLESRDYIERIKYSGTIRKLRSDSY